MIRRDITLDDGSPHWLLVSQVEHARISGLLAAHWSARDLSPYQGDDQPLSVTITEEILAGITHHDDGWASWECTPEIDPERGRPYSFMNELPLKTSLAIWDRSIAAAAAIGPLAGWIVAGHFSELLKSGNHEQNPLATRWLATVQRDRDNWFASWSKMHPALASAIADRALHLLQACDFLSLWLCCDCPVTMTEVIDIPQPFILDWPQHQIGPYRFTASRGGGNLKIGSSIEASPWPFDINVFDLTATAWLVPRCRFSGTDELLRLQRPVSLQWQFRSLS